MDVGRPVKRGILSRLRGRGTAVRRWRGSSGRWIQEPPSGMNITHVDVVVRVRKMRAGE